jgi:5-methylcytosine-specific restriction endonuclease McrA
MADNRLQQILTLKLNKNWLPIGQSTVEKLMVDMVTGVVCGIDIDYEMLSDDTPDFSAIASMYARTWNEWVDLPVRPWEQGIRTKTEHIRIPYIVVCSSYNQIPNKQVLFPSKANVWNRDKNCCLYTGLFLKRENRSIDHIHPVAKGGQNEWDNLATCHRDLNSWKSDTLLEDCYLDDPNFPDIPELVEWRDKAITEGQTRLELLKMPTRPNPKAGTIFTLSRDEWSGFLFN